MFERIADWLIARAKKTPYFHLPKYMDRWWLVPYTPLNDTETKHGQYFADWRKQPFTWLLQKLDIGIRIHEILRSDRGVPLPNGEHYGDDEAMFHDHPWPYISIILKNGYTEVTPIFSENGLEIGERRKWYGPGSIIFRRAEHWHRLELSNGGLAGTTCWIRPCTTLFITLPWKQKWGYLTQPRYKRYYRDVHAEAASKLPEIR